MTTYKIGMKVEYKNPIERDAKGKIIYGKKTGKICTVMSHSCLITVSKKYCTMVEFEDIIREVK